MNYLTTFITLLALLTFQGASAKEACFLFINGEKEGQEFAIDQLIRPIISTHIHPIKPVPAEGITSRQEELECLFEVSLVYSEKTLNMSLDTKRTESKISGFASSGNSFPDNIRETILTILFHNFSASSKKLICSQNADLFLEECPQFLKTLLIHQYNPDKDFSESSSQAVTVLAEELQTLIQEHQGLEFIGMAGSFHEDQILDQGPLLLKKYEANLAMVFHLEGDIIPSKSSMWKALASINVTLNAFKEKEGSFIKLGSFDIKPERIPVRTFQKKKSFREKHYGRAARKLIKKWSENELNQYLEELR